MNDDRSRLDEYEEEYSEYEDQFSSDRFEKIHKGPAKGKILSSNGKKKIKPRQEFQPEFSN